MSKNVIASTFGHLFKQIYPEEVMLVGTPINRAIFGSVDFFNNSTGMNLHPAPLTTGKSLTMLDEPAAPWTPGHYWEHGQVLGPIEPPTTSQIRFQILEDDDEG